MVNGVFVANVSFFDANGMLLPSEVERHLEWLAEAGVHGFVPCGTTGESAVLTREERSTLIKLAVKVARQNKLKVVAGCGGNNTLAVRDLVAEAADLGADATLVVTPYYNKPTARGLKAHYEYIAEKSPLPIVLYNVPGRTAVSLTEETIADLFRHERILGIKEASGSYGQWVAVAQLAAKTNKALIAGDDDAFAVIRAFGGTGIISASANVAPKQFVELYRATLDGKWPEAFQLQMKLSALVKSMFLETSPAPAKYALSRIGNYSARLRLPLVPITPATEKAVADALTALEVL